MKWQEIDTQKVMRTLGSSRKGLSDEEAVSRLKKYGANEIKGGKKIKPVDIFFRQFKNFLVIILIIASIFSVFIGEVVDSAVILLIVVLNAVFGFFQEFKAEKSMEALKNLAPQKSTVVRDGKKMEINSKTLVPGDIVILEQGDKVPTDIRLLEVSELKIDESAMTGESVPVKKTVASCKTATLADMKCIAFMGTVVAYGRATGVVVETGMSTEVGKIAHTVHTAPVESTPLQKALEKFGKNLGTIILIICTFVVLTGFLRGSEPAFIIIMGVALAVAAIPEGLPAVITITLAIGMQRMAKKNAIIRKLQAVETLGSVNVICSDKTGTLTKNEMTIRKIWTNYKIIDVMGQGYEPSGDFLYNGKKIGQDSNLATLMRVGALCTNAQLKQDEKWSVAGDPTEGAIIVTAHKLGMEKELLEQENPRKKEIPFSSERKMMSTINAHGRGLIMCTKGAPEIVLPKCTKIMCNGVPVKLTEHERKLILNINKDLADHALRVLAIAYKETTLKDKEDDLIFLGLVGIIDPPRSEVKEAIKTCSEAGIRVVMITGDNRDTAVAIADQLGIKGNVLTGEEIEKLRDKLVDVVEDIAIYARVNPEHKAIIVEALREKNHIIAMTGDGINDAPALKKANIGVAMNIKGTDVAKEASDMVIMDDNFSSIVAAIKEGRTVYDNIKKFILYLLSSNISEVMIVFSAILIGLTGDAGQLLLPLTAVQLLWINLITDGFPALALGMDPALDGTMKRKPRDPREKILSGRMLREMFVVGTVMTIIVISLFVYYIQDPIRSATISFTTLVLLEMINAMRIRITRGQKFFSNKKLLLAIGISVLLQLAVVYITPLQSAFNTLSLNVMDWGMIVLGLIGFMIFSWIFVRINKPYYQYQNP